MRVILLGDWPPPFGGVAIHVRQLHDFLRQQGVEVSVLDVGKGARPAPDVTPCRTGSTLARALAKASPDAVLHVHTSGNNRKCWALALFAGALHRARGGRAVVTLHSGLLPAFLEASALNRQLARTALAPYGKVIAVSPAQRDALLAIGVSPEKIQVQPAFLASQVKAGPAPEGFAGIRERRFPLLAMAHHPSKLYGRAVAFAALAKLRARYPDVGLALFGPGTDAPEFLADAQAHEVEGLIERFGNLEHDQALGLISRADVFVRPTTADGDAISVREALALGVPCVASDAAVRPSGVRLFRSGDPDALVESVCDALLQGPAGVEAPDAGPVVLEVYRSLERRVPALQPALAKWA